MLQLFYCCLLDLQTDGLLCEIKTEELFSNVIEVCQVSQAFWVNHVSHVLQNSRRTRGLLAENLTQGVRICRMERVLIVDRHVFWRDHRAFENSEADNRIA